MDLNMKQANITNQKITQETTTNVYNDPTTVKTALDRFIDGLGQVQAEATMIRESYQNDMREAMQFLWNTQEVQSWAA